MWNWNSVRQITWIIFILNKLPLLAIYSVMQKEFWQIDEAAFCDIIHIDNGRLKIS